MAKVTDPTKKTKSKVIINNGKFNADTTRQVTTGSGARLERDEKGNIRQIKDKNYNGLTAQMLIENRIAMKKADIGDKSFTSQPAPRVGGSPVEKTGMASGTGNKKLIIKSIRNTKKSDASPQAKRAAIRIHKK